MNGKMLKILKKKFVYTATNEENGFTLLSMLLTFSVIIITLPLLVHILKLTFYQNNYDELSLQQFTYFLRDEIHTAIDINVKQNTLELTFPGNDKITIKKYNNQIIRQVNNKGHDVFAREVSNITFVMLDFGVHVTITSLKGAKYEKTIAFLK